MVWDEVKKKSGAPHTFFNVLRQVCQCQWVGAGLTFGCCGSDLAHRSPSGVHGSMIFLPVLHGDSSAAYSGPPYLEIGLLQLTPGRSSPARHLVPPTDLQCTCSQPTEVFLHHPIAALPPLDSSICPHQV